MKRAKKYEAISILGLNFAGILDVNTSTSFSLKIKNIYWCCDTYFFNCTAKNSQQLSWDLTFFLT